MISRRFGRIWSEKDGLEVIASSRRVWQGADGVDDAVIGLGKGIGVELIGGDPGVIGAVEVEGASLEDAREMSVQLDGEMAVGVAHDDETGADFEGEAHFFAEFARNAPSHGFGVAALATGKFPETVQHTFVGVALGNQDLIAAIQNDRRAHDFVGHFFLFAFFGEGFGAAGGAGFAEAREGADGAARVAGGAYERAEFHPGLVGGAGMFGREEGVGQMLELAAGGGAGDVAGQGGEAGENAHDVAIERGAGVAEGQGGDGGGMKGLIGQGADGADVGFEHGGVHAVGNLNAGCGNLDPGIAHGPAMGEPFDLQRGDVVALVELGAGGQDVVLRVVDAQPGGVVGQDDVAGIAPGVFRPLDGKRPPLGAVVRVLAGQQEADGFLGGFGNARIEV